MTELATLLTSGFLPELVAGMAVNFQISATALALGLALGLPLGVLRFGARAQRYVVSPFVGLMRAAPTFVVMFFLLNVIPQDATLLGFAVAPSPWMIVALSLVPYAAAYAADNGREAALQRHRGANDAALLFLPNILRAFFVLVMSSGAGAAIGVSEGVAVVLREAERWPTLGEKLVVFGLGVLCFGAVFQTGFALMRLLRGRLVRHHLPVRAP
ncbi:MAG: hypothetical protein AAFX81_10720 [Pseudomonadota bacterium]